MLKDILYRYYNCNIQAPKMKADEMHADKISFNGYTDSQINVYSGYFDVLGTTFYLDIPYLGSDYANNCGDLTVFAVNTSLQLVHVIMICIAKQNNTMLGGIIPYQNYGNCNVTSSGVSQLPTVTTSGSTRVVITFPQAVNMKYIWRSF